VCGAIYKHARTRFKCTCVSRRRQTSVYVDRYFVCDVIYTQAHAFQMYVFVCDYANMRTHFKFRFKFRWVCQFLPSRLASPSSKEDSSKASSRQQSSVDTLPLSSSKASSKGSSKA